MFYELCFYLSEIDSNEAPYIYDPRHNMCTTRHKMVTKYFRNNEATLGACSYFPMPYGEPDMYMPLHYVCGLSVSKNTL